MPLAFFLLILFSRNLLWINFNVMIRACDGYPPQLHSEPFFFWALLGKSGVKLVVTALAVLRVVHIYVCKSYYTVQFE